MLATLLQVVLLLVYPGPWTAFNILFCISKWVCNNLHAKLWLLPSYQFICANVKRVFSKKKFVPLLLRKQLMLSMLYYSSCALFVYNRHGMFCPRPLPLVPHQCCSAPWLSLGAGLVGLRVLDEMPVWRLLCR